MNGRPQMDSLPEKTYLDAVQAVLTLHCALRRYSKRLQGTSMSGRRLALLRRLTAPGEHTIGSIASFLFINESSASELVSKMEKAGLVSRKRSARDQRIVHVELTVDGGRAAAETPIGGMPLLRERMKELSPHELQAITRSVSKLIGLLEGCDEAR
jgi:DNA-binding MarR family transcriptional regulator